MASGSPLSKITSPSSPASSPISFNPTRIHILGAGNVGNFVAHSLAGLPESTRPSITLLLHRKSLLEEWQKRECQIDVLRNKDGASEPQSAIGVEVLDNASTQPEPIQNLIVCVKTPQTVNALVAIKDRLRPESTVLFLQNGMGAMDEVTEHMFSSPSSRPQFVQGIISHGLYSTEPFVVTHAGLGTVYLGVIPRGKESEPIDSKTARPILNAILSAPALTATEHPYTTLLALQLEKLAINAVANPLTAILNQGNHILLTLTMQPIIHDLVCEIAAILRALPELQGTFIPSENGQQLSAEHRFADERMESLIMEVLGKVQKNVSSMCQDMRAGKKTEIGYINGYLVKRAREVGVPCGLNGMLVKLVRTKEENQGTEGR